MLALSGIQTRRGGTALWDSGYHPSDDLSSMSEPCETVGGPSSGVPCIFPFKFEGITYETCQEYFGQIVCATELDKDGNAINYGICGANCPQTFTTEYPTTTTKGKLSVSRCRWCLGSHHSELLLLD